MEEKLEKVENSLQLRNLSKTRWRSHPQSVETFWTSFDDICSTFSDIGNTDLCEEEGKAKSLGLLAKIKAIDFIVSIILMKNIMYKTRMVCDPYKLRNSMYLVLFIR